LAIFFIIPLIILFVDFRSPSFSLFFKVHLNSFYTFQFALNLPTFQYPTDS